VWIKARDTATSPSHTLNYDSSGTYVISNNTGNSGNSGISWNTTGFNVPSFLIANESGIKYVSWTFREQPKFFDVVTYTGNGGTLTVSHNLGSTPGCIMVKKTSGAEDWYVWHRSLAALNPNNSINLNLTNAAAVGAVFGGSSLPPTSTNFSVGPGVSVTNGSGETYVAYLFAHNAGGFGLTGTDNVISCGNYTTDASGIGSVTLGWEPQWVLFKVSSEPSSWRIFDNMRGFLAPGGSGSVGLTPNTSAAESSSNGIKLNASGFTDSGTFVANGTVIYIAIRRGPMKVPTVGTSVFAPVTVTGNDTDNRQVSSGFITDFVIGNRRTGSFGANGAFVDRLRGPTPILYSYATDAEATGNVGVRSFAVQDGMTVGGSTAYSFNYSGQTYVNWMFRRAPGFFDEVCYTGTGTNSKTQPHNLGVVPELVIYKARSEGVRDWVIAISGFSSNLAFTTESVASIGQIIDSSAQTSTTIQVQKTLSQWTNASGITYVAYLFATCAGVSKVGSYTGTGTTLQIDCGFTAGARFVLIKRTDSTGDWYVWDSARGIVAGNDPYLLMNSSAVEVTGTDYVDTYSAGFEISSTAPAGINASAGTYIFLAIA
jgi:hypothetical protein